MKKCPSCEKPTTMRGRTEECSCGWWYEAPDHGPGPFPPAPSDTTIAQLRAELAASLEREGRLREALEGMLAEWDKFTRYGSPMAKAANERVQAARAALAPAP